MTQSKKKVYSNYNYTCARSASKCRYLRRLYAVFMRYYCARIGKCGQITTGTPRPPGIIPEFYPLGMGLEIGKNWLGFSRNAKMRFPAENGRYGGIENICNQILRKKFLKFQIKISTHGGIKNRCNKITKRVFYGEMKHDRIKTYLDFWI